MNKKTLTMMLQHGADDLAKTFRSTPDDKLNWKPMDNGRAVLDLFGEAAQAAGMALQVATSRGETKISREKLQNLKAERADWTREIALEKLENFVPALVAEIEKMSDEELDGDVTMPLHGGVTMPMAAWLMMPYRSFVSRMAQINYIQTLYGDSDFH